jgi:hypothetical protein
MAGGQEHRHRPSLGVADDCRLGAVDGVEDDSSVVHPALQGRQPLQGHRIRDPGPPLVEHDDPGERGQPLEEAGEQRLLPHDLDVAAPVLNEQEVSRAIAEHLVGDRPLRRPRVPGLGRPIHEQKR